MAKKNVDAAAIHSRAKDLMSELKDLTIRRDTLQAQCDAKIKPVQNEFDKKILPVAEQIAIKEKALEVLATEHRDVLFAEGTKSLEVPFGSFGFREGAEALILEEDEPTVLAAIKKSAKKFIDLWINKKETLLKTAVKKSVKDGAVKIEQIQKLGMDLRSEDKFFYKIGIQKL